MTELEILESRARQAAVVTYGRQIVEVPAGQLLDILAELKLARHDLRLP